MDISLTEELERILSQDTLPGTNSQLLMAPLSREFQLPPSDSYTIACVLILLYPKDDEWHVALIQRSVNNPHDKHAGQISLPGGKLEQSDESYEHCALREAEEEIGIPQDQIGIIGELTSLYVSVSDFLIYPFVGFTSDEPEFVAQESEVSQVLEVKLRKLLKYKKEGEVTVRDLKLKDIPYYDVFGHKVWGATAMILSEFEAILAKTLSKS